MKGAINAGEQRTRSSANLFHILPNVSIIVAVFLKPAAPLAPVWVVWSRPMTDGVASLRHATMDSTSVGPQLSTQKPSSASRMVQSRHVQKQGLAPQ